MTKALLEVASRAKVAASSHLEVQLPWPIDPAGVIWIFYKSNFVSLKRGLVINIFFKGNS